MNRDPWPYITAEDLLPEFEHSLELEDGGRYVVARHGPEGTMTLYTHRPYYRKASDSWLFTSGSQARSDEDYWLPERQFDEAMIRAEERSQVRRLGIFKA
ncbi:hypothetical protein KBJ94_23620 [Pseudomonas sp. ITA]|uniref:hypothetical protein n=1 Tax=Pseudomonas sp. ITA TaxID=2825841 RepID=UPI0024976A56|nr:hypothetical protein [Pseudomonas sp. ITA]MDI2145040.1 hypothetical protein [Pseudomonas sp. ITA]